MVPVGKTFSNIQIFGPDCTQSLKASLGLLIRGDVEGTCRTEFSRNTGGSKPS